MLEDYGCVAEAFCALHQLTGEGRWLDLAGDLLDSALDHFTDGEGGFFDTADDAETAGRPPGRPDRQRHAVRPLVADRGPGHRARR